MDVYVVCCDRGFHCPVNTIKRSKNDKLLFGYIHARKRRNYYFRFIFISPINRLRKLFKHNETKKSRSRPISFILYHYVRMKKVLMANMQFYILDTVLRLFSNCLKSALRFRNNHKTMNREAYVRRFF